MSKLFDKVILIAIIINTILLGLEYYNQNETMKFVLLILNLAISSFFILEVAIKILALGKRYF